MIKTNKPPIFLVRLDETVLWGSLGQELLIKLLRENIFNIFLVLLWSLRGPAYCNYQISMRVRVDPSLLVYKEKLLDYLQEKKKQGVRIILYSDATDSMVQMIARYLNIFDEALGSSPQKILSPIRRLEWYRSRYGNHDYVLISSSFDDQPLWCNANFAILVNGATKLRKYVTESLGVPILREIVEVAPASIDALVRPHIALWLRNFSVVLFLLLFSQNSAANLVGNSINALFTLLVFSTFGSASLILDRILNIWEDRAIVNAAQKERASYRFHFNIRDKLLVAGILLIGGTFLVLLLPSNIQWLSAGYLLLGFLYAFRLRDEMFINMFSPAFQVALVGLGLSLVIDLNPEIALLAGIFFFYLSMELLRAFGELQQGGVSGVYRSGDSGIISTLGLVAGIIAVAMFIFHLILQAPELVSNNHMIVWSVIPIALYWISRIWFLAYRQVINTDPASFLARDEQSYLVLLSLFFIVFLTI